MKYLKILLIAIAIISLQACDNAGSASDTDSDKRNASEIDSNKKGVSDIVNNKKEYYELKALVEKCKKDFNKKIINETEYSKMMEGYGDIYVKSVAVIPPEIRYTMAISCFRDALKYDRDNIELKKKLQQQQSTYQIVNQ